MPYLWCSIDPRGGNLSFSLALFAVLWKGVPSSQSASAVQEGLRLTSKMRKEREGPARTNYWSSPGCAASVSYRGSWFPQNRISLSVSFSLFPPYICWPLSSPVALKCDQRCELCKPKCLSLTFEVWITVSWLATTWLIHICSCVVGSTMVLVTSKIRRRLQQVPSKMRDR